MKMTGKTVLITGSTDGVGRHVAGKLAAEGANVLIHGRDEARAKTLADEIRRELAPYLGLAWLRRSGASAQLLRAAGELPDELQWLIGVRFWY